MKRISIAVSICVLLIMAGTAQASSYLTPVVSESGFNHNDSYGDPSDIIGAPTDQVWDSWANAYIKVSMKILDRRSIMKIRDRRSMNFL